MVTWKLYPFFPGTITLFPSGGNRERTSSKIPLYNSWFVKFPQASLNLLSFRHLFSKIIVVCSFGISLIIIVEGFSGIIGVSWPVIIVEGFSVIIVEGFSMTGSGIGVGVGVVGSFGGV